MEVEDELGICCSDLIECVGEFIFNTAEVGSEAAKTLANRGGPLLDLLENASSLIGKTDVQFDGEVDILKILEDLLNDAELEEFGGGLKFILKMFRSKVEHFKRLVNTDWNRNCAKNKTVGDLEAVQKTDPIGTPSKDKDGASSSQVVYRKVTPLKNKTDYVCEEDGCGTTTTNLTVYKRHMRDAHKKKPDSIDDVKVTCMLLSKNKIKAKNQEICNSKLPLSEMYRHLKDVHHKPRPKKDKYLKFFKSYDGGKTFTEPVYLGSSVEDPDKEDRDKSVKTAVKRRQSDDDHTEDQETESQDGTIDKSVKSASAVKRRLLDGDHTEEQETETQVGTMKDVSHKDTIEKDDDQNESQGMDSSKATPDVEKSKPITTQNSTELTEEESVRAKSRTAVLEPEKSKSATAESFDDVSEESSTAKAKPSYSEDKDESEAGPSKKKHKADSTEGDQLEDEVCPDVEFIEKSLMPGLVEEDSDKDDCPDVDFIEKSLMPGLVEDDSDMDDDDEEDFNKNRLDNKARRYIKRKQPDIYKKEAWEEDDNKSVLDEFEDYLKMYKYASNSNKDSSTYKFSFGHMFKYPDSYLNFHRKSDPTFNFKRVISFNSQGYVQLSEPLTWMNSIAGSGQENAARR